MERSGSMDIDIDDLELENALADLQTLSYPFTDDSSDDLLDEEGNEAGSQRSQDMSAPGPLDAILNHVQNVRTGVEHLTEQPWRIEHQGSVSGGLGHCYQETPPLGKIPLGVQVHDSTNIGHRGTENHCANTLAYQGQSLYGSQSLPPSAADTLNPTLMDECVSEPVLFRSHTVPPAAKSSGDEDGNYQNSTYMDNMASGKGVDDSGGVIGNSSMDANSSSGKDTIDRRMWRRTGGSTGLSQERLEELIGTDPKKAKRIMSNRASAARSKERKTQHIQALEWKTEKHKRRSRQLRTHLEHCQRRNVELETENAKAKQHVWLIKGKIDKASTMHRSLQRQLAHAKARQLQKSQSVDMARMPGLPANAAVVRELFSNPTTVEPPVPHFATTEPEKIKSTTSDNLTMSNESWNMSFDQNACGAEGAGAFSLGSDPNFTPFDGIFRSHTYPTPLDKSAEMGWSLLDWD